MSHHDKTNTPAKAEKEKAPAFKGYTMEELKYQRAMMELRKDFAKEQVLRTLAAMHPAHARQNKESGFGSRFGLVKSIAGKVLGNLNTLDYIMMGISLFGTAKKAYSLFRRKKQ